MESQRKYYKRVLVAGSGKLTLSITTCMLKAGHDVTLYYKADDDPLTQLQQHQSDLMEFSSENVSLDNLTVCDKPGKKYDIAIAITREDLEEKYRLISELENYLQEDVLIAVNFESYSLDNVQQYAKNPASLIGLNWTEPAHTTFFLEVITNEHTREALLADLLANARDLWQKDPYVLTNGKGIRSRLMCSLIREAFYLIENNYVGVEDIDRACRNDAGYYLPFSGNFRYMDLMGGYMYGIVMQDLNPELSRDKHLPDFFRQIMAEKNPGMRSGKGFHRYSPEEAEAWDDKFRKFSYEIRQVINKYHCDIITEPVPANS